MPNAVPESKSDQLSGVSNDRPRYYGALEVSHLVDLTKYLFMTTLASLLNWGRVQQDLIDDFVIKVSDQCLGCLHVMPRVLEVVPGPRKLVTVAKLSPQQ